MARATARHAAELLRDEGLVVKVPGLGTFVRKPEAGTRLAKPLAFVRAPISA